MIKIVHLISGLRPGGAEMTLLRLVSRMRRDQFENVVVSLTDRGALGDAIERENVRVYTLGIHPHLPNPLALVRLHRLLRRERPAILQSWLYDADFVGLIAEKTARVPAFAMNIRCSSIELQNYRLATRAVLKLLAHFSSVPDAIVVNSDSGRRVHEAMGYKPKRWEFIPNGFDTDEFKPDREARAAVRGELGIQEPDILIGAAGRYEAMKDFPNLLAAAASVVRLHPNVHVALSGSGVDETNAEVVTVVRQLGLEGRVHLLGYRRDMPRLMAAFDVFCSSSAYGEGMQNTVGEAMAAGVPCAVTDVGDAAILVGDTGFVVPVRNPDALASAIHQLIEAPDRRLDLGKQARQRIATQFSIGAAVARYENLYAGLSSARADE